jgi:hypothetical protein
MHVYTWSDALHAMFVSAAVALARRCCQLGRAMAEHVLAWSWICTDASSWRWLGQGTCRGGGVEVCGSVAGHRVKPHGVRAQEVAVGVGLLTEQEPLDLRPPAAREPMKYGSVQCSGVNDLQCRFVKDLQWPRRQVDQEGTATAWRFRHNCQLVHTWACDHA